MYNWVGGCCLWWKAMLKLRHIHIGIVWGPNSALIVKTCNCYKWCKCSKGAGLSRTLVNYLLNDKTYSIGIFECATVFGYCLSRVFIYTWIDPLTFRLCPFCICSRLTRLLHLLDCFRITWAHDVMFFVVFSWTGLCQTCLIRGSCPTPHVTDDSSPWTSAHFVQGSHILDC